MLKGWPVIAIGMALIILSAAAHADGLPDSLIKQPKGLITSAAVTPIESNKALRLTSNKNVLLRLDQDAASVIVNNPNHAAIMLDSPRLLIIMPRLPGTTSFMVLNAASEVILQRDIIVSNVQPQYVRIRRMCSGNDPSCLPAAYFYCPDGCYEVTPVAPAANLGNVPPPAGAPAAAMPDTAVPSPVVVPEAAANSTGGTLPATPAEEESPPAEGTEP